MRKILLSLYLLAGITFFANAQGKVGPITITHGKEIEQDKEKIVRIAGEANNKIYTLATKGKSYFIKVFSADEMALESVEEIDLNEFNGKDIDFDDIAVINNKVYILGSVYDKGKKQNNLFAFEVSTDGKVTKNRKSLFKTSVTKKRERGAFYFKDSPAGDQLLVLHAALFDKEEVIQYEIKLIDENLQILASHLEKVPFKDRNDLEFSITDFDVNVYGDIFLAINESYRDRKAKKNIEKFQVHAFKVDNDYQKEVIKIDFTNREVINCEMLATRDGKLNLVGFYSSVRKNGKANKKLKGVYTAVIDVASNEVTNLKFNEFDLETKIKLIGERRANKGKDVAPLYFTHSLIEKEDGGLILLSEYQLVVLGRSSGIGPLSMTPITHINNEIIVTSIAPDGSVAWSNVIPKDQRASFTVVSLGIFAFTGNSNFTVAAGIEVPLGMLGKGPEYLSAMPIYEDGQLTVVFNDSRKNVGETDIEEVKRLGNYNKAMPTAFVFDNDGNITRMDQENYEDGQLVLRPRVHYRKSPKEYIIYSSRKSKDKLGRMFID